MRSHPDAALLYANVSRTQRLDSCRLVLTVVCSRTHAVAEVRQLPGVFDVPAQRVVALPRKVQRTPADLSPGLLTSEQKLGRRLVSRTDTVVLVDLLDEDTTAGPTLLPECSCRRRAGALTRAWLRAACEAAETGGPRRVVAP